MKIYSEQAKKTNNPLITPEEIRRLMFGRILPVDVKEPHYMIGIDTYDKNSLSYCFGRKSDGVVEILLCKTMHDEKEFKQEVENLAKYFKADVL